MEFPDIKGLIQKPRAAYEKLLSQASWKRGIGAWFFFSFIGLAGYLLIAAAVRSDYILLNFGFGTGYATAPLLGSGVIRYFLSFIIISGGVHLVARGLKGTGSFKSTLYLFGYANIVTAVRGLLSGIITMANTFLLNFGSKSILLNKTMPGNIGIIILTSVIIVSVFSFDIWVTWVRSRAVSVSHGLPMWKSLLIVFLVSIVITILSGWLGFRLLI